MPEQPAPGRINWLASYPKSGNTWMRMLLANYDAEVGKTHSINTRGVLDGVAGSRWLFDTYLGIASNELHDAEVDALMPHLYPTIASRTQSPVWLKVHELQNQDDDGRWRFSAQASRVAIYIIRNPLDVAVSNAFHDGNADMALAVAKLCDVGSTISAVNGSQMVQRIGDWSSHVISWVEQSPIPVIVIRYEDMLADADAALSAVIAFAQPDQTPEPARVARAVYNSRFDALRAAENAVGFRETPVGAPRFFREGRAGAWGAHLSQQQVEHICRQHAVVMQRFGYGIG